MLVARRTWYLVLCPTDTNIVTCKWVFTIKYHLNGYIARHKSTMSYCTYVDENLVT
ncbi:unnamed protein product [Spirodela intermedia]|uniref:Uncharacterized protein n=1 Tax=Spirodela intermedia TaxID=51605 RepID=A0A7I8LNC3_SPIIN|nr:unnamed protein product [Spirodela intermedia]